MIQCPPRDALPKSVLSPSLHPSPPASPYLPPSLPPTPKWCRGRDT
ncbi:hypothetical protein E2C01_100635 [Portunus trituberculatus]|uniref:Uncharacterized protein n=1 Tax=Portunus trituberculatus TaxID=210409 RepID=A0A5B7K3M5_PORTR|nr:hypothetical protein [Portunus trituberculatus]